MRSRLRPAFAEPWFGPPHTIHWPATGHDLKDGRATVSEAKRISEGGSDSLSEATYRRLRFDIVRGRLRPNERLIEAELADRLAVSRTPVRESLQRLAADGLVVSRRRGWVVYEHTPDEIREIYEIRSAL